MPFLSTFAVRHWNHQTYHALLSLAKHTGRHVPLARQDVKSLEASRPLMWRSAETSRDGERESIKCRVRNAKGTHGVPDSIHCQPWSF